MLFTSSGNGNVVKGIHLGRYSFCLISNFFISSICWCLIHLNLIFQATAYVMPQLWQPPNGTLMTNDVNDNKPAEESAACIALSKNDSYVMSASGGKVSLFNMMTFKVCYLNFFGLTISHLQLVLFDCINLLTASQVMTTFMSPPPAATFLAFHPQDNNIIAIGMEDSSIQIYNVRVDEVKHLSLFPYLKPFV